MAISINTLSGLLKEILVGFEAKDQKAVWYTYEFKEFIMNQICHLTNQREIILKIYDCLSVDFEKIQNNLKFNDKLNKELQNE